MRKLFLFFLLCVFTLGLGAQDDVYQEQIAAVKRMITAGNYQAARQQAAGLMEAAEGAQLPAAQAEFAHLLGRAYLDDPKAQAKERAAGIKALRNAARLFGQLGIKEKVNTILVELGELQGKTISLDDLEDQRSRRKRRRRPVSITDSLAVESQVLSALVNSQDQTIAALNDSQARAEIELQRQEILLDSLTMHALEDSLLVTQQQMMLDRQAAEINQAQQTRNFLFLLGAAILSVLGVLYWRFLASRRYQRNLEEKNEMILKEQKRSEELLLNVLPAKVASELMTTGKAMARKHESVSVLFVDFKGFSVLANELEPDRIVSLLDEAFQAFDLIIRKYELEKIKTIGDAYMCAGGLPEDQQNHAARCVKAALEMQTYLSNHPQFLARIGIHSGPVVAGVVGLDKFVYDIWGDTVNRAARLEVAGEIKKVNISDATKALLDPARFSFKDRGTIPIKNLGELQMYFVDSKA